MLDKIKKYIEMEEKYLKTTKSYNTIGDKILLEKLWVFWNRLSQEEREECLKIILKEEDEFKRNS